jgi:O-antigen ligase
VDDSIVFLAIILGIAGLVWAAILYLRGGLLGGLLAVMLAGVCFSVPFFKLPLGALPLTVDRILLVVLVGQYILYCRWGRADPKPLGKPEIVLCLFTAWMVVSTFRSDWTAYDYQPVSWLIIYYLMPLAVYWIARQTPMSERNGLAILACLCLFGVYLAATALAEYFQAWSFVFPRYIVSTAAENKLEFIGRGRGPLLNPIGNGVLLTICLGATLMWWPRLGRPRQLLLLPVVVLILGGIYVSLTRSVWMSGLLAVAMCIGLPMPRNWRLPVLGGGLLVAVLVTATQWENLVTFKRDRNLTAEQTADSVHLRPVLARLGWNMFLDHPLFGCGYSQYKSEHLNYTADRSTDLPLEKGRGYIPHNVVFSLLTETGLVGLGLFLAAVAMWGLDAWRLWQTASAPLWARQMGLLLLVALGAYFVNGMFHDISVVPMANMTLFFLAGLTAGLRPMLQTASAVSPAPRGRTVFPASPQPSG